MPTIKALGQISIVDLTDGYSVSLYPDTGSFPTDANYNASNSSTTFSLNVTALQGSQSIIPKIGDCVIKNASGQTISNGSITVTKSTGNTSPLTITVYGGNNPAIFTGSMATITIPVYVEGTPVSGQEPAATDIVINKIFTLSAAPKGAAGTSSYTHIKYCATNNPSSAADIYDDPADDRPYVGILVTDSSAEPAYNLYSWTKYLGEDGEDGDPGTTVYIHSSNGTYFKNTGVNTRLTVYIRDAEGNSLPIPNNLEWYKGDPASNNSTKVTNTSHRSYIDIGPSDVTNTETYFVVLEETT